MGGRRAAVSVAFLFFGICAGTLLPRIPALKENLHLTDGQVGIAFFASALAAVAGAGVGRLVLTGGAKRAARITTVANCLALIVPAFAPSFAVLVAAFAAIGLFSGLLDVLLNAQAAEIERDAGRPMIIGFHAYWSLGAICGSAVAAGAAALSISPAAHFTVVALAMALVSGAALAGLPDTKGGAATLLPTGTGGWHLGSAVAVVAVLGLLGFMIEGGAGDWSAIYLRDFGHAGPGLAAIGFAGLSVAMTLVRFMADRVTGAAGPRVVAALGGLVAAIGFGIAIALPIPVVAIAGFALVGIGTAVLVPLAFSAGANLDKAGNALGIMTAAGYAGGIVGPPLIGAAADHFGLRLALLIPTFGALAVFAMIASTRVLPTRTPRRLANAAEGMESKA
jgi:MFS family permease